MQVVSNVSNLAPRTCWKYGHLSTKRLRDYTSNNELQQEKRLCDYIIRLYKQRQNTVPKTS